MISHTSYRERTAAINAENFTDKMIYSEINASLMWKILNLLNFRFFSSQKYALVNGREAHDTIRRNFFKKIKFHATHANKSAHKMIQYGKISTLNTETLIYLLYIAPRLHLACGVFLVSCPKYKHSCVLFRNSHINLFATISQLSFFEEFVLRSFRSIGELIATSYSWWTGVFIKWEFGRMNTNSE